MSSSTRGRGGKFQKPKRGGGKHFSRDLRPINAAGEQESMWAEPRTKNAGSASSSDDSSDDSSDESSSSDAGPSLVAQSSKAELSREERRAAARARREAAIARQKAADRAPGDLPTSSESEDESDNDMPANPNHTAKAAKQASIVPVKADADDAAAAGAAAARSGAGAGKKAAPPMSSLSRREREALQAQQAKERYQKLHAEGKTDEARADLARLRLIKEKREADAAVKAAEMEEKRANDKAKSDQLARDERQRALAAAKKDRLKKK